MKPIYLVLFLLSSLSFYSCSDTGAASGDTGTVNSNIIPIYHYNVIFAPDLSNRLTVYKKPVADNEIVDSILNAIFPKIATYNRKMNQMDKYSLDFINEKQIVAYNVNTKLLRIDLGKFKGQDERIKYIAPFEESSRFKQDKQNFTNEYLRVTNSISGNEVGSDIWTYLNEGIDSYKIDTSTNVTIFDGQLYKNEFKNVLVLFTDGYLESSNNFGSAKMSKGLPKSKVDAFREDYLRNANGQDVKTFFKKSGYGIVPLENPMLKNLDIIVMELYDRSVGVSGATKAITDMEIIKLFWEDWLEKSGVHSYKLVPTVSTAVRAKDQILSFMNIR